jgi:outer membrane protein OmpA-like peptidoglycan-associated protein
MNDKWEFYKDAGDKWRWRRTAPNGNIVGATTEGYANKIDCEANARRNGWDDADGSESKGGTMTQKELNDEKKELKSMAFDLYKEQSFKDGNDFIQLLQTERHAGEKFKARQSRQIKNILYFIALILCVIAGILLMTPFKKTLPVDLSEQTLSKLKGMMVIVLDPKSDEKVVVFGDTHFEFAESSLSLVAKMELDKDVQSLKENSNINVRMAGYTSATGTEEVNQKLSEQRANAVRDYLIEKGIAPERITVVGYGRTKPAVYEVKPGDVNSNEAMANMRVLFEVVVK